VGIFEELTLFLVCNKTLIEVEMEIVVGHVLRCIKPGVAYHKNTVLINKNDVLLHLII
jgi:hypothetical protein